MTPTTPRSLRRRSALVATSVLASTLVVVRRCCGKHIFVYNNCRSLLACR